MLGRRIGLSLPDGTDDKHPGFGSCRSGMPASAECHKEGMALGDKAKGIDAGMDGFSGT